MIIDFIKAFGIDLENLVIENFNDLISLGLKTIFIIFLWYFVFAFFSACFKFLFFGRRY